MNKAAHVMKGVRQDRNYLQLILGLLFVGYGGYRLYTFFNGVEHPAFRIIVVSGMILFGGWDLYRFFKPKKQQ